MTLVTLEFALSCDHVKGNPVEFTLTIGDYRIFFNERKTHREETM
jgi:hypothetical protein